MDAFSGSTISLSEVDELNRISNSSGIYELIREFYTTHVFGHHIKVLGTGVVPHDFESDVNDQWKKKFRWAVFNSILVYGICVIGYDSRPQKPDDELLATNENTASEGHEKPDTALIQPARPALRSFHVIPVPDVIITYKRDTILNQMTVHVKRRYPSLHSNEGLGEALSNVRVLIQENSFVNGVHVTSPLATVQGKILAYENLITSVGVIVDRMAGQDWAEETVDKQQPPSAEDLINLTSADDTLGRASITYQSERIGLNHRDSQLADQLSRDDAARNRQQNATLRQRKSLNPLLDGSRLSEPVLPTWQERSGYTVAPNKRLVFFPTINTPGNIAEIANLLLSEIAFPFSLNASVILDQVTGNSSHTMMMKTTNENIKRFVTKMHRLLEDFMRVIYNDLYRDEINADQRYVFSTIDLSDPDRALAHWKKHDVRFSFEYIGKIEYEQLKMLYDDGVIDEESFVHRALALHDIAEPQKITPSKKRERDEAAELSRTRKQMSIGNSGTKGPEANSQEKEKDE